MSLGGSNSGSQTVTQINKLPKFLEDGLRFGADNARFLYNRGHPPSYSGSMYAGLNPTQTGALTGTMDMARTGGPDVSPFALDEAQNTLGGAYLGGEQFREIAGAHDPSHALGAFDPAAFRGAIGQHDQSQFQNAIGKFNPDDMGAFSRGGFTNALGGGLNAEGAMGRFSRGNLTNALGGGLNAEGALGQFNRENFHKALGKFDPSKAQAPMDYTGAMGDFDSGAFSESVMALAEPELRQARSGFEAAGRSGGGLVDEAKTDAIARAFAGQYGAERDRRAGLYDSAQQRAAGLYGDERDRITQAYTGEQGLKAGLYGADRGLAANADNTDKRLKSGLYGADRGLAAGAYNADRDRQARLYGDERDRQAGAFNQGQNRWAGAFDADQGRRTSMYGDERDRLANVYGDERDLMSRTGALAPQYNELAYDPSGRMLQAGNITQFDEQNRLNEARRRWNEGPEHGQYNRVDDYIARIQGIAPGAAGSGRSSTTTPTTSNALLSALGGGIGGAQLGSAFGAAGGPWGAGIGAILGLLNKR